MEHTSTRSGEPASSLTLKLHLGCGSKHLSGFVNLDRIEGADIVRDIVRGLPFTSNTVDYIFSEDFLEHVPQSEVVFVMSEMCRVLKPGGVMEHYIPNAPSLNYLSSPTHLSHWTTRTVEFFTYGHRRFTIDSKFDGFHEVGFDVITNEELNVQNEIAQSIHIVLSKHV